MAVAVPSFPERLYTPGPKRLLALDGGGVRGLITLGYLARIEAVLRTRHQRPELVLSDYFDVIGGTSTGAIIAAALALGYPVSTIRALYLRLGSEAFQPKKTWLGQVGRILGARFDERPLEQSLKEYLGERTLGGSDFHSGLVVVVKRADTGSVWPLVNFPRHKYYQLNKDMKLWEVVRASTAAPIFFKPKLMANVGVGEPALFVDGGVSMHSNPALLLLMVATLQGFALGWPLGEHRLLLCSVGTGEHLRLASAQALSKDSNMRLLPIVFTQLLSDTSELVETLLQWFSQSPTARLIDTQIGTLSADRLTPEPLLTYLRYNLELTHQGLTALGLQLSATDIEQLHDMSNTANIPQLDSIGQQVAMAVQDEHFPAVFDLGV